MGSTCNKINRNRANNNGSDNTSSKINDSASRAKPRDSSCSLYKWADTVFWLCRAYSPGYQQPPPTSVNHQRMVESMWSHIDHTLAQSWIDPTCSLTIQVVWHICQRWCKHILLTNAGAMLSRLAQHCSNVVDQRCCLCIMSPQSTLVCMNPRAPITFMG